MAFIDSVVASNWNNSFIWGSVSVGVFIITQISDYLLDIAEGNVVSNNFVNLFSRINYIVAKQDLIENEVKVDSLNQSLGQNYEIIKNHIFLNPIRAIFSFITMIVILTIMFLLSWKVAIIILVIIPLVVLFSNYYSKHIYSASNKNVENMKRIKEYINDQHKLTKEDRFLLHKQLNSDEQLFAKYEEDYKKKNKIESFFLNIISYGSLNGTILLVILLAGYFVLVGDITIGSLFAFQSYTSQFWTPSEFLLSYRTSYMSALPVIKEYESLLKYKIAKYSDDKINKISLNNFICLDQYNKPITKPIDFTFDKGNIYVITGDNGVGKTTLVEAILGYNCRYKGELLINNSPLISNDIVYVSSSPYISSFFNIKTNKESSGQKKLMQIEYFVKTIKTVYIFDEPTNFLDSLHKIKIRNTIEKISNKDNIVIIVTHDKELIFNDAINLKITSP